MKYRVDLRDKNDNITSKEFSEQNDAEDFYFNSQEEFKYIEMRILEAGEQIDHAYLVGSVLKPIWLEN